MRFVIMVSMAVGLSFVWTSSAYAEKRFDLKIGNDDYATLPNLNNATKDAADVAARLKGLGFDVIVKTNTGRGEMGCALADFVGQLFAKKRHPVAVCGDSFTAREPTAAETSHIQYCARSIAGQTSPRYTNTEGFSV